MQPCSLLQCDVAAGTTDGRGWVFFTQCVTGTCTRDLKVYLDCTHVMEYVSMQMMKKTEVALMNTCCMMCTVPWKRTDNAIHQGRMVSDEHSGRQSQIHGLWTFFRSTRMILVEASGLVNSPVNDIIRIGEGSVWTALKAHGLFTLTAVHRYKKITLL